jgi:hypothetical protein
MEALIKGLISGAIFFYIARVIQKDSIEGKLFYSNWMLWLGLVCLSFVLLMIYLVATGNVRDELGQYISLFLLIVSFGVAGIACILEYRITYGDYDDEKITFKTPWGESKQCLWSNITKVTYSDSMHWYIFHCNNDIKMRFSTYLTGINEFIDFANQKNLRFEK